MKLTFEQKNWIRNYELARVNGTTFNGDTQEYVPFDEIEIPDWYTEYLEFLEGGKQKPEKKLGDSSGMIAIDEVGCIYCDKGAGLKKLFVEQGKIGGMVRAEKLSPERRSEIARLGGLAKGKHGK